MCRVESRGDAAPVTVDEIGNGRVRRPALAAHRAGKDPRMPVGEHPLLPRFEGELSPVFFREKITHESLSVIPSVARDLGGRWLEDHASRPLPPRSLATLGMTLIH